MKSLERERVVKARAEEDMDVRYVHVCGVQHKGGEARRSVGNLA